MNVVVSVPHSGTRSLRALLAERGMDVTTHFHFNEYEKVIKGNHVHIPIRHPLSVAESWARRKRRSHNPEHLIECYKNMFEFLASDHPRTVYCMETLPRMEGLDEGGNDATLVADFRQAITEQILEPNRHWFESFYPEQAHG